MYKDWLLRKGDILISHINSEKHLGKSAIFLDNDMKMVTSNSKRQFHIIKNLKKISRFFSKKYCRGYNWTCR